MKHFTLFFAAALFAPALQAVQFNINPFVTCVDVNPDQTLTVYFGYESFEASIVQIVVGAENRFIPGPDNRNQPILFFPGYQEKAFRVVGPSTGILWLFNGFGVRGASDNKSCTPPPPTVQLPPGAVSVPYFQKLGAVGGKGTLSWLITNPPPGLSLSSDGTLTGTPTQAGSFTVNVTASDGITTTPATYGLTVNAALTVSDPLSTRPPGFVPQFRTVTQIGGSNSAQANCDATEFVVTGGGTCTVPNQNTVQGRVASTQASGNGWAVVCSGGTAIATAVCAK